MTTYEPMTVTRVRDDSGSHIEPPLDPAWSELDQLRWKAGVVIVDAGVPLRITLNDHARLSRNGVDVPGIYGLQLGHTSSARGFHDMWDYLNGLRAGAVEALRVAGVREDWW
ncbi:hypothetical protein SEA_ECLIPTUS_98 [Gordonia phage Ecliptus]|uniref:Uncharacterized protein n=2 Tax=Caudoviricetes TaxID=2731619 RepID=A0A345L198_9CAUD|nr:hypothetical protein HOT72_gp091 [Gordonia phage Apricot]YP_009808430.1 hypothetical protein HOT94_gp089 [Gordonia phage Phistory]UTN91554.1 hypothetical protein SEA_PERIWINKLE_100 [Gordonia phage Periwinkle]WAB10663.1 hypothetical protein SEA_ECLIPTUS_98 [Gordonia phage Ecliptus]WNM69798.1 hypothetical protein SEA_CRATER_91 [Gordonia phage Crater]AXH49050.1 hypothetical protein SEA_APRICOT_91 [Gordonia phage Apricot]AXQ64794.1 hypothetical protein SEA_PHISTORY_89 [Gordonia phage Phistory]